MEILNLLLQFGIVIYIPLVTYFIINALNRYLTILDDKNKCNLHVVDKTSSAKKMEVVLPLQLQAYERLILFLERIRPISLVNRHLDLYISKQQFQMNMLKNIRDEFDHNLSQQLFVSESVWQTAKGAREELAQMINLHTVSLGNEASAANLAEQLIKTEITLIDQCIKLIKEEMKGIL